MSEGGYKLPFTKEYIIYNFHAMVYSYGRIQYITVGVN